MLSQNILLILFCLTVLLGLCNAECCGAIGFPFAACNGIGDCNMFCCNCDNGCISHMQKSAFHQSSTGTEDAEKIFKDVDKNLNGAIDFDEALEYAVKQGKNETDLKTDKTWFSSMDKDHDDLITRNEFDASLEN